MPEPKDAQLITNNDRNKTLRSVTLIILAAFLSHYWMTSLEFQLDDWVQVYDAGNPLRQAALLGGDPESTQFVSFFRPLLHLSFKMDVNLFGPSSYALHLMSLLYHVLTALLFFFVIKRFQRDFCSRQDGAIAFLSALIFAVHPSTWGAVSWVAARSDVLATLCSLGAFLALMSWRVRPLGSRIFLVFILLMMAMGAKEGAIVVPIIFLIADRFILGKKFPHQGKMSSWLFPLLLIALPIAYTLLRQEIFGQDASLYGGAVRVINGAVIKNSLLSFVKAIPQVLGGFFNYDVGSKGAYLQYGTSALLVASLVSWIRQEWRPRLRACGFLVFFFGLAMGPAMSVYPPASLLDPSRLFYFGFPFVALLIALALSNAYQSRRPTRDLGILTLILSLLSWSLGGYSHAHQQKQAAHMIRELRDSLSEKIRQAGDSSRLWIVTGLPHNHNTVPLYGVYMPDAFRPFFTDAPGLVYQSWKSNLQTDLRSDWIFKHKGSVQILRWDEGEDVVYGNLVDQSQILPAPTGFRPRVVLSTTSTETILKQPIHPRDISSLELEFDQIPKHEFLISVKFWDKVGYYEGKIHWKPQEFGASKSVFFVLAEDRAWLFRGEIGKIEVKALGGSAPRVKAINFAGRPPRVQVMNKFEELFPLSGPEPVIKFTEKSPCLWYRIRVFFDPKEQTWTLPRHQLLQPNGTMSFRFSMPGRFPNEPAIPWPLFSAGALEALNKSGTQDLKINFTIEGLRGQIAQQAPAQSKSPITSIILHR